jgi:hypothetical protein
LRENGEANAITNILAASAPASASMRSDDFLNYMADMPAGYV